MLRKPNLAGWISDRKPRFSLGFRPLTAKKVKLFPSAIDGITIQVDKKHIYLLRTLANQGDNALGSICPFVCIPLMDFGSSI